MSDDDPLIPKHGAFRKLKTFQLGQLIYDITFRFCNQFIERTNRTRDQMTQAARSGVQNIAEGSQASGTSKKTELKLTNVARGSLEELRLDYEDYLRQRGLPQWRGDHPVLQRFKKKRCATMLEFRLWVADEVKRAHGQTRTDTDKHGSSEPAIPSDTGTSTPSVPVSESPCSSVSVDVLVANGALSLLNLCCYLLNRQLAAQATAFENEGGFTERIYHRRRKKRGDQW